MMYKLGEEFSYNLLYGDLLGHWYIFMMASRILEANLWHFAWTSSMLGCTYGGVIIKFQVALIKTGSADWISRKRDRIGWARMLFYMIHLLLQ